MAQVYDLIVMLDPNAPEGRSETILQDTRTRIESTGSIVGDFDWGTRRMTFEIDHRPEATYHLFQFEGDAALLDSLGHNLKITDDVLRHRIIKVKPGTAAPPEQRREAPAARDEDSEGTDRVAARAAADAPSADEEPSPPSPAE
ncbi:MAG: 30S ribosomal protein S6 [Thermoleophilaceae bacterium]|nr:30S ribosomal protein S6 [Thermoleophilaceae bacterium]